MPPTPLLANEPFDPNAIEDMAPVFLTVCSRLGFAGRVDKLTEVVAKTIIELAQRGVRNPAMLRKMALMEFNVIE